MDRNQIRLYLHRNRTEVLTRGHSWDVADVMCVLEGLGCFTEADEAEVDLRELEATQREAGAS